MKQQLIRSSSENEASVRELVKRDDSAIKSAIIRHDVEVIKILIRHKAHVGQQVVIVIHV